jgi:hypothetical protein
VGDAGREAGGGRFVPDAEVEFAGEVSDGVLGEAEFGEGGADVFFTSGAPAGAVVGEGVGGVVAVGDDCEVFVLGDFLEAGVEFGFAEVAAVGGFWRG